MIIRPHPYGRMANRLISASTFMACAEETGDTFLNLGFGGYYRFFEGTRNQPIFYYRSSVLADGQRRRLLGCVNIWNTYDKRGDLYSLETDDFIRLQRETRFLFMIGWSFSSRERVRKHRALIRRIFTPVQRHRDAVDRVLDRLRQGADQTVGVHVRQTDYRRFKGGCYFYPPGEYARLMQAVAGQLNGKTRFLICSDAALDMGAFAGLDAQRSTGHPVEDNYALAGCDYIMGPPSTYSIWAAYYGGARLLAITSADAPIALSDFSVVATF